MGGAYLIDAALATFQQVFSTLYRSQVAHDFLEETLFGSAKSTAALCCGTDRAVVFHQKPALAMWLHMCHVAFKGSNFGQLLEPLR